MKIRTGMVALVVGAWFPVHQKGTLAQSLSPLGGTCSSAADCNDGTSCTDDACNAGACAHTSNGSCNANPKEVGYWRRLCGGSDDPQEFYTDADAICIRTFSCAFSGVDVDGICRYLGPIQPIRFVWPSCGHATEELMALALNLCRGRVTTYQEIDSRCANNATAGGAFREADLILCNDRFSADASCDRALCETREINQGRALNVHGLVVSKLSSGGLHLAWTPPLADMEALTATPRSYRVWRATGAQATLVQIVEVAGTSFDDTSAEHGYIRYDVTPVW